MLTTTDISIDILCAVLFVGAIFHSVKYLWRNNITQAGKIKYLFIIVVSAINVFQTTVQLLTGHSAMVRLWDISNFIMAFFVLMVAHRIAEREQL